jgi:two-component system response regulator YesN
VPDAHDLAEEIAEELEANYHRPFSAEPFLHRYKLSAAALNKLFRHHKGMRPAEYLLKLRMEKAKQLLETMPDALIKDIAAQVGYPDPHYFSKVFHQATGLWPTEYQKQK